MECIWHNSYLFLGTLERKLLGKCKQNKQKIKKRARIGNGKITRNCTVIIAKKGYIEPYCYITQKKEKHLQSQKLGHVVLMTKNFTKNSAASYSTYL
jgi:hypothetical protein